MKNGFGRLLATTCIVVACAVVCGVKYVSGMRQLGTVEQGIVEQTALQLRITGLTNPSVHNTLNARYSDVNGNLVADAPLDPARQVDPPILYFSYIPMAEDEHFDDAFKELLAAISTATGKPVQYVEYASPEAEMVALRDGRLQIAGLSTGAVPIGVNQAGFVPFAQMADANGNGNYRMDIIAASNSSIRKLKDLRGHELTLTEPTSNSGYRAPLVLLRENGLLPPNDYLLRYSQGHLNSIYGIKRKLFESAAVADDVLAREVAAGHIDKSDFRIIYTSDQSFPSAAVGYAYNLKPDLAQKISDVVLHFNWAGTGLEKRFGAEGKCGFTAANYKNDWRFVRDTDEQIGYAYRLPASGSPAN